MIPVIKYMQTLKKKKRKKKDLPHGLIQSALSALQSQ